MMELLQLTCSIMAQLKGKLLVKCELPQDLHHETNEILGWVHPAQRKQVIIHPDNQSQDSIPVIARPL